MYLKERLGSDESSSSPPYGNQFTPNKHTQKIDWLPPHITLCCLLAGLWGSEGFTWSVYASVLSATGTKWLLLVVCQVTCKFVNRLSRLESQDVHPKTSAT